MNWNRKDIKERGKTAFLQNYIKTVAVAFVLALAVGGIGGGNPANVLNSSSSGFTNSMIGKSDDKESENTSDEQKDEQKDESKDESDYTINIDTTNKDTLTDSLDKMTFQDKAVLAGTMGFVFAVVFLTIFAFAMLVNVFIYNPLEMGCCRFFFKNLEEPSKISNVVYAFDHSYKNIVKTLFYRDIYIILWSMVFIIPGCIKKYEYRMIPYLLAENPELSPEEAFRMSKEMMKGNKWKAFVLDFSFIGWEILSALTCGILSIFFVEPYRYSTNAALYETLRYGTLGNDLQSKSLLRSEV